MKPVRIIGTAALFLLLGTTAPVWAQKGKQDEGQGKSDKQSRGKGNAKAAAQPSDRQQAAPQARREQPQQQQRQQQAQDNQRGQQRAEQQNANQQRQAQQEQRGRQQQAQNQQRADQQNANRQRQADQQRQAQDQQNLNRQRAEQQRQATRQIPVNDRPVVVGQAQDNRPPGWDKGKKVGWNGGTVPPGQQARLPQSRQQELIVQQQSRRTDYRRSLDQQRLLQVQWTTQQQRDRMTYYRYQQNYWSRMRQQQLNMQRNYNYYNDPYFYTASSYNYSWGGNNYQTNQYGANMLRAAVNNGYAEGYRAGQADRQDRFGGGFQNSYAYQDANLGYNGNYVSQGDYNYYFRQGFDRGYQDGYNSRYQYGQYSNGNRSILGAVLSTILNLQSIR